MFRRAQHEVFRSKPGRLTHSDRPPTIPVVRNSEKFNLTARTHHRTHCRTITPKNYLVRYTVREKYMYRRLDWRPFAGDAAPPPVKQSLSSVLGHALAWFSCENGHGCSRLFILCNPEHACLVSRWPLECHKNSTHCCDTFFQLHLLGRYRNGRYAAPSEHTTCAASHMCTGACYALRLYSWCASDECTRGKYTSCWCIPQSMRLACPPSPLTTEKVSRM